MLKRLFAVVCVCGPLLTGSASADTIDITTPFNITGQPSYTFGDWIFELVNPANEAFNLINNGSQDFIVAAENEAGDFRLRRLDDGFFTVLSMVYAGAIFIPPGSNIAGGTTTVGGVDFIGPGNTLFQTFNFSGEPGVTNVSSVLFSPITTNGFFQVSELEVSSVPEPATGLLVLIGLAAVALRRDTRR